MFWGEPSGAEPAPVASQLLPLPLTDRAATSLLPPNRRCPLVVPPIPCCCCCCCRLTTSLLPNCRRYFFAFPPRMIGWRGKGPALAKPHFMDQFAQAGRLPSRLPFGPEQPCRL